jgi:fatty acid-binding protein DegV
LLKIKPIITVDKQDGKYNSIGKERTIKRALEVIVEHLHKAYGSERPLWISVLHGQFLEEAENLATMISARLNVKKIEILRISPVLGVHTGPGVVGAAVVPMDLMEGLE